MLCQNSYRFVYLYKIFVSLILLQLRTNINVGQEAGGGGGKASVLFTIVCHGCVHVGRVNSRRIQKKFKKVLFGCLMVFSSHLSLSLSGSLHSFSTSFRSTSLKKEPAISSRKVWGGLACPLDGILSILEHDT